MLLERQATFTQQTKTTAVYIPKLLGFFVRRIHPFPCTIRLPRGHGRCGNELCALDWSSGYTVSVSVGLLHTFSLGPTRRGRTRGNSAVPMFPSQQLRCTIVQRFGAERACLARSPAPHCVRSGLVGPGSFTTRRGLFLFFFSFCSVLFFFLTFFCLPFSP